MTHTTTTLLATVSAAVLLALIVATVKAARADERAWQLDKADRVAGVVYTMRRPSDGPAYIERSGPDRKPGAPIGNLETMFRQDHVQVRQSAMIVRRQGVPLVQVKVTS